MTSLRSVVTLLSTPLFGCVKIIISISFYIWLTSMTINCRWTRTYLKRFLAPLSLMLFGNYSKKFFFYSTILYFLTCFMTNKKWRKIKIAILWYRRVKFKIRCRTFCCTPAVHNWISVSITHCWKKNCRNKAKPTCALIFLSSSLDP